MRTVKEISELTGISVRTLHYYDEIGLLKPTQKSDAGYRLYDDRALEILQQILFFREFDIPLKEIKAVLENPALERNQILQMQRKMLVAKKERMEHLIASIDDILKGENKMDFAIFSKTEVEEMFQTMFEHMPDNMKELAVKEFGSIEEWKKHYIKTVSSEEMQKGYAKVVEWYGGKEQFLSVANNPISKEAAESYNQQFDNLLYKLAAKKVCSPDSSEVRELVSEYGFLMKQLSQIKKEHGLMVAQAQYYRNEKIKPMIDEKYGNGTAEFFAQAFEAFYKDKYPYNGHPQIRAIMTGTDMEMAFRLFTSTGGYKKSLFMLDTSFEHFHYLPNTPEGEVLLKLLVHPEIMEKLDNLLLSDLGCRSDSIPLEHDATDASGNPILLAYDFDMQRINRFNTGLNVYGRSGNLICFDFQIPVLKKYLTATIHFSSIDLCKFKRGFLHEP